MPTKHKYNESDILLMKEAVSKLRKIQERIEDDVKAYQEIDEVMTQVENIIDSAEEPEGEEDQSFMEYIEAVDAAMIKYFGIDTSDAGIEMDMLASAQEECQTPENFALWFGSKYDLTTRRQK